MARYSYSNVSSRYGAPMGRHTTPQTAMRSIVAKLYLQRVRVNAQGYDPGGAYWGGGLPLFVAFDDAGAVEFFWRARDRAAAKRDLASIAPKARFYR